MIATPILASGDSVSIDATAADVLTATDGAISADDAGSDKLLFWDDSESKLTHLTLGTGLEISGTTLNNTGGLTGTGSVDNAILRADGTGGSTLQTSGLIVDDAVVAYSITGDASTDVITAAGHDFTANQGVRFASLTGGSGLNTSTNYFVRDISGDTFKVSTTSGGAAVNFTTNITAGSVIAIQANVAISQNTTETNSALVLTPKGTGAFILGPKPDGTTTGGNARGEQAIDLQTKRATATQVASGLNSVTLGVNCTATSAGNTNPATYSVAIGISSQATGNQSLAIGSSCVASGTQSVAIGISNTANTTGGLAIGGNGNFAQIANYPTAVGGNANNAYGANSGIFSGSSNQASASHAAVFSGASSHSSNTHSISFGPNVLSDRRNMFAHGGGQFAAQGDAQRARFVMRRKTTDDTPTELFLDGSSTRLTIPSGKIFAFTINISGVNSTGSAVAHYLRQYCLKNVAGTCTEVYAPVTIGTDNPAGTSIALSAYDVGATEALKVEVTGIAAETWRWVASVDAVEIAYGN